MTATTERRYAMTRVAAGDYLLPSNDQGTLWRIYSYEEDGSAQVSGDGKTWRKLKGMFWAIAKYDRPLTTLDGPMPADFLEWEHWKVWEACLRTRGEAVEAALRA